MEKKKVLVLGHNGMLGSYVHRVLLESGVDVAVLTRIQLDASNHAHLSILSSIISNTGCTHVVNCIGVIKPRVNEVGVEKTITINSIFPRRLADVCENLGIEMIHITTDCVFNGKIPQYQRYTEQDSHDVMDVYGRSKSLGEPENCQVIRTSIIGEEVNCKRSLVEWVKSNKGKEINGFVNHWWNGLTCLELARCILLIISDSFTEISKWKGVRHLYTDVVSKYELLQLINNTYELDIKINRTIDSQAVNRCLSTSLSLSSACLVYTPFIKPIADQIRDMKDFSKILHQKIPYSY